MRADRDDILLRVPPGMREALADEAKVNARSMNAEIVDRLHKSLKGLPQPLTVGRSGPNPRKRPHGPS